MTQTKAKPSPLSSEAWPHLLIFLLCAGGLTLAALLSPPRPDTQAVTVAGLPLPPLCSVKRTTGYPCPGCGLTRSWVSTMNGGFSRGLGYHRLGWLLMLYAAGQALRHGLWLMRAPWRERLKEPGRLLDKALIPIASLFFINWLIEMGRLVF